MLQARAINNRVSISKANISKARPINKVSPISKAKLKAVPTFKVVLTSKAVRPKAVRPKAARAFKVAPVFKAAKAEPMPKVAHKAERKLLPHQLLLQLQKLHAPNNNTGCS